MAMEVEMEGEDGSKFSLQVTEARNTVIGRGCGGGFHTKDRTVSRRHVSFQLSSDSDDPRVSFEVIGRNPFWVHHGALGLKVFRKFEKGQLELGDRFSLSAITPFWLHFNFNNPAQNVSSSKPQLDIDIDQIDLSQFDPVKEFGFLAIGHEFDDYPKGKIRNVKDWEWFLEEARNDSDDDDDEEGKQRKRMKRKRKKKKGPEENEDDEEWGGESDDEGKDLVSNMSKGKKRACYSTRSKDRKSGSTSSKRKRDTKINQTFEDDEDDETLGGFIVDDEENDQQEELDDDDDEEEEEFEEEEEEED
ncbi:uncharacterized protein LOC107461482 isoform X2 [Arachis duranensis]|uniref:Uncharacterized protein LOC107461482 isoform X2 n=1 Tax=Arachis duranensis TaxID=130453 RepID=A0A6P4C1G9_ARADU|nr:uncharacterized protein LOC107461482 isoform X2 [Arachis duranensis]